MADRFDVIREWCRDKACLDVGIVGDVNHHLREPSKWVFHHITEVARSCVGIDIDPEALARVKASGYANVLCADASHFALLRRFDVVVAGELIEHLVNPGLFLDVCRQHIVRGGVVVLSTPNTFSVNNLVKGLTFGRVNLYHDHVNAYMVSLLTELLRRYSFETIDVRFTTERNPGWKNRAFRGLSTVRPSWSEGLVVVGRRIDSSLDEA